jgi:hypothetical protein
MIIYRLAPHYKHIQVLLHIWETVNLINWIFTAAWAKEDREGHAQLSITLQWWSARVIVHIQRVQYVCIPRYHHPHHHNAANDQKQLNDMMWGETAVRWWVILRLKWTVQVTALLLSPKYSGFKKQWCGYRVPLYYLHNGFAKVGRMYGSTQLLLMWVLQLYRFDRQNSNSWWLIFCFTYSSPAVCLNFSLQMFHWKVKFSKVVTKARVIKLVVMKRLAMKAPTVTGTRPALVNSCQAYAITW